MNASRDSIRIQLAELSQVQELIVPRGKPGPSIGLFYGVTIFASAFLLFQVEPLITKMILPWFGGGSAIWTTCLVFFQVVLLLGYLYAYWVSRILSPKVQTRVHLLALALGILALPIIPSDTWKPAGPETPTLHILLLLSATVGLPYFLLSTTSPLLQAWYAKARPGAKPYRLFALSNAGSMLGLLTYPVLVEPFFSTRHQAMGWSVAFACVGALCATLAIRSKSGDYTRLITYPGITQLTTEPPPRLAETVIPAWSVQALWVALTACASTLLLAITNHLSQNVAAIPFLWVLPLSLYLLSFVLCFEGKGWYRRDLFLRLLVVALGGMIYALSGRFLNADLVLLIPLFSIGLFICCMVCHGELARLKPPAEHLTRFYLMCSLGGALGGMFVGVLAPYLFRNYFELPIGLAGCSILTLVVLRRDPTSIYYQARWRPAWLVLVALTLAGIVELVAVTHRNVSDARLMVRNFYGRLKVVDDDEADPEDSMRELLNGTIQHGKEFLAPDRRSLPTTYFGPNSGVGLALRVAGREGKLHVGIVGLGAGTIAAYSRPGDRYTFYEINPLVIEVARAQFYFLKDSRAQIEIIPGDARLSLERQPQQDFDVLAVDAFSGDAIPVHLLTREAFILYFRHLKPGGVLAVHVSNRYLDLPPVVQRVTQSLGKRAVLIHNQPDDENEVFRAIWILVSDRAEFFSEAEIEKASAPLPVKTNLRLWTDDYSSLLEVLK